MIPANARAVRRESPTAETDRRSVGLKQPVRGNIAFAHKAGILRDAALRSSVLLPGPARYDKRLKGAVFSSLENLKSAGVLFKTISSAFLNNFFSQGEEGIRPV
jgi:hypothetical protein